MLSTGTWEHLCKIDMFSYRCNRYHAGLAISMVLRVAHAVFVLNAGSSVRYASRHPFVIGAPTESDVAAQLKHRPTHVQFHFFLANAIVSCLVDVGLVKRMVYVSK